VLCLIASPLQLDQLYADNLSKDLQSEPPANLTISAQIYENDERNDTYTVAVTQAIFGLSHLPPLIICATISLMISLSESSPYLFRQLLPVNSVVKVRFGPVLCHFGQNR
jgi:hypothetical protein